MDMENIKQWKKLVTRESTLLERTMRFSGYRNMLPAPFTIKQKDLLAVYSRKMTTQYVKQDDFSSKVDDLKNDLGKIGFDGVIKLIGEHLSLLDASKNVLLKDPSLKNWQEFVGRYENSRAVILVTFNLAALLKQETGREADILVLQKLYDDAEARSSGAWRELAGFFEKIAADTDQTVDMVYLYTGEEFTALVSDRRKVDVAELEQRDALAVMKLEEYGALVAYGKEAEAVLATLELESDAPAPRTEQISGTTANAGSVRGTVKLVLSNSDYGKIESGDIIVTYMTHPDMVPILSKVAGIITDEGGVLCHAAIVSRELGIPCIIGTKVATQVLKDSDRVEVDADHGIVRILG